MRDITQAVFETDEGEELPFHGELIVEGEDGQTVTLDEADIMEDVVIESFEAALSDAVASDPNAHLLTLREIDEMLEAGDYESALQRGCELLEACGVDEARIDEFKKGFKVSAGARARMSRMRNKPKSGGQLMALRARRRAARKSSSRMKRARYYKQNKRRIARRRSQLQNSQVVDLDARLVAEMAEEGMIFVVVGGGEPTFASSREIAEGMLQDGQEVIELTDEQIDEARKKAGKCKSKKPAEDMPMEAQSMDDEEDEEDDEESDDSEDDSEDEEDDEDEEDYDESIQESEASKLANEIAKFMKKNPRVGYGELATRFKIGRDVAQQAVILAGKVAGARGDEASWLHLAKEIMGKLLNHSAGSARPAAPTSTVVRAQVASVEGDEANLSEDDDELEEAGMQGTKPKVRTSPGNKAGCIQVKRGGKLPKPKLKGKEGAIKSAHATGESANYSGDHGADLDEEDDQDDGQDAPRGVVEVTVPLAKAEALVAAAAQNGLDAKTKVTVREGLVSMFVPASVADAIRKAVA